MVGRIHAYGNIAKEIRTSAVQDNTEEKRGNIEDLLAENVQSISAQKKKKKQTVIANEALDKILKSMDKEREEGSETMRGRKASRPNLVKTKSGGHLTINKSGQIDLRNPITTTGVLAPLVSHLATTADRYLESGRKLRDEVLLPLEDIVVEVVTKVNGFEVEGGGLVKGLTEAEGQLKEIWTSYKECVDRMLSENIAGGARSSSQGEQSANDDSQFTFDTTTDPDLSDPFLKEMTYRILVNMFQTSEKSAQVTLANLFKEAKEIEFRRRSSVRELLLKFYSVNEDLYLSLPPVQQQACKALEGEVQRGEVEKDVMSKVRSGADDIIWAEKTQQAKEGEGEGEGEGGGEGEETTAATTATEGESQNLTLSNPLVSPLISKLSVMELKSSGFMSSWSPVLCLLTQDKFLHIFQLPDGAGVGKKEIHGGTAPEIFFGKLLPKGEGTGLVDVGGIAPMASIAVVNAAVKFTKNASFDIVETVLNSGAGALFNKTTQKKVTLRAVREELAVDWIAVLTDMAKKK